MFNYVAQTRLFYPVAIFLCCFRVHKMHLKCKRVLPRDGLETPQCPWRGECPFHAALLLSLRLSCWSSLSSRQDPWVCTGSRYGAACRRCAWLQTAEHGPFSLSLLQVSPLYIGASKVVCSVPFWIHLLFLPLFVSPLYRHYRPSQLRYQDHLVGRKPWYYVAPVRIFSLLRLLRLSWIKIFFSASCFQTLLIWYDMIYDVMWYELQLRFHRWQLSVNLCKNMYKGRNNTQNNTKTEYTKWKPKIQNNKQTQ